jgi:hypothetical protein
MRVHGVSGCNNDHLARTQAGSFTGKAHYISNLFNFDYAAVFRWLYPLKVAMIRPCAQFTSMTPTAVQ